MDVVPALRKCLAASQLANHHLRQRDQQMRLALDSLGGGRWEWDIARQKFACYGRFYEAFGVEAGAGDDTWERWHTRKHPADAARLADKLERAMRGQLDTYEAEFRILDTAGRWRWVISRGLVGRRDAAGRPLTLMGMDVDVTAQHEAQDALHAAEAKYTTIYQTLPDAAGISRISDGCYIDVNPAFCALLGAEREDVLGRTSRELNIWASDQERTRMMETYRREGKVDRLPMVAHRDGVRVPGLMSARPVVVEGEDCFLFVFHDMTEAQRASDELRALNNLLQQAGRMARLGAWESTREAGMVYWSDICADIHSLPSGSPPPNDYVECFVAPAWKEAVRTKLRACLHHQCEWDLEHEVVRADGRVIWVRARGEPVLQDGQVTGMRGVLQDIDEAKRAEQRLRQSEDRFSRIFHLMPYPMGMTRQSDGAYVEVNPAWVQVLGFTREEAVGSSATKLGIFQAQDRARLIDVARQTGQLDAYEVKIITRSGEQRTALQSMRATEFDGEACWLFALQDITDRKRSEEQVREREALLSLTISAAALGLWDWDLQTGMVRGDARWGELRGAATSDATTSAAHWTTGVAADALAGISAEVARHMEHPATPFDVTWKVMLPQGGARWIRNLGKIIGPGGTGQPTRMLGVAIDVTPQREQQELLQKLAHYDALTGLPNRVLLAQRLQDGMSQARARGTQLGVAYLDLDGFKPINDRLGHGAGDRLLVVVAGRLSRALRPQDCVARLGGDEFVILMPGLNSQTDGERLLGRVMESISSPYTLDTERVAVTASIGYTVFPCDDADADTLLRHADQAMYAAKQAGRNRFHQFDAAQERAQREHHEQGLLLSEALTQAQFVLFLQPKVVMQTGQVVGAEALARWQHPERGLLPPGAFLPLLDGTALEIVFGQWVVEAALAQLERLQEAGLHMPVSINISARHLQHPGFGAWIVQCLARYPGVAPSRVELEITESAALYDLAAVADTLAGLRALGLSVALDDFGTGYSSLTYLRRLPMDTLKIDQSFVQGMLDDTGDRAIVQGVIGLARSFAYQVIAEGVETIEQGLLLLQLGCANGQGYCIARPMPIDAFIDWARRWQPPPQWQQRYTEEYSI
ncbi:EAL domain-containing protein [Acidovorax sp. BoFeN1]|uniref:sensor domain-containing protein n=1 Tax=Acidovorax sp. BoFeN1 TaxID=1231053 RepID=UPI000E091C1F|nr:EAL domain-containing protein [Acidovorax sp. BoFeN1]RDD93951.1 EAL domain-containing protein [Acidovorax sp. BoFeN1]